MLVGVFYRFLCQNSVVIVLVLCLVMCNKNVCLQVISKVRLGVFVAESEKAVLCLNLPRLPYAQIPIMQPLP